MWRRRWPSFVGCGISNAFLELAVAWAAAAAEALAAIALLIAVIVGIYFVRRADNKKTT